MKYISAHNLYFETVVPSSDGTKRYTVCYGQNDSPIEHGVNLHKRPLRIWSCTCPDYAYRHKEKQTHCKHIEHVLALSPEQGGPCHLECDEADIIYKIVDGVLCAYISHKDVNGYFIPAIKVSCDEGEIIKINGMEFQLRWVQLPNTSYSVVIPNPPVLCPQCAHDMVDISSDLLNIHSLVCINLTCSLYNAPAHRLFSQWKNDNNQT